MLRRTLTLFRRNQVSFAFDPVPTLSVVPMHRLGALATRVGQSFKLHGAAIASGTDAPLPTQLHVQRPLLTHVNGGVRLQAAPSHSWSRTTTCSTRGRSWRVRPSR
jgi:hypothetical protein